MKHIVEAGPQSGPLDLGDQGLAEWFDLGMAILAVEVKFGTGVFPITVVAEALRLRRAGENYRDGTPIPGRDMHAILGRGMAAQWGETSDSPDNIRAQAMLQRHWEESILLFQDHRFAQA